MGWRTEGPHILCPEASGQASVLGFVQAWPAPSLLVEARWGWKKRDADRVAQGSLKVTDAPDLSLRAVRVTANEAAREIDLFIPENMRVPKESVIARVLDSDHAEMKAYEDLSWWISSNGQQLGVLPIRVVARRTHLGVHAFITPKI